MLWFADLAARIDAGQSHVINDSKTPSGRVHVGAMRGVILHDAMFRVLAARGVKVRYLFGVDDYDPLDEIPKGHDEFFAPHVGKPLCDVPALPGSSHTDIAEHYISEFFDIFGEIGVAAERYRMRDFYRNGKLDESIDRILLKADVVRQIYKDVSLSEKSAKWHPFQTVCEVCGKVGTTEVVGYDGKEVEYFCRPNLVKWAKGCGHHGKVSPFGGRGKLPWKLEWVAKWRIFPVTIEGAGKDHNTKGGSRDVSAACLEAIFGEKPPMNIPYEFFLSKGKKMSSSKGVGSWARDMADFLAPEALRYLILRTSPEKPVDFPLEPNDPDPKKATKNFLDEEFIVKLFNDLDRQQKRVFTDPKVREDEKELYGLCQVEKGEGEHFVAPIQLVLTFVQMPHVDLHAEMAARKGSPLTEVEKKHLDRRIKSARYWLDNFARDEERVHLQDELPASAAALSATQRAFLHRLAQAVEGAEWKDDALQAKVFDTARRTPIAQPVAFQAIYRVFLDKTQGPPAGALMAVLPRELVRDRLTALPFSEDDLWKETAVSPQAFEATLAKEGDKVAHVRAEVVGNRVELLVEHRDGKVFAHRVDDPAAGELALRSMR